MKNRNRVTAKVGVAPEFLAATETDPTALTALTGRVMAALNRTAAERTRRVFGAAELVERVDDEGIVWLTYVASTEPAPTH